jgi:hypothetical protein
MEREAGIRIEIGQPVPTLGKGHATDVDPAGDVVENNLKAPGFAGVTAGRGDIDGVAALQRCLDRFFGR